MLLCPALWSNVSYGQPSSKQVLSCLSCPDLPGSAPRDTYTHTHAHLHTHTHSRTPMQASKGRAQHHKFTKIESLSRDSTGRHSVRAGAWERRGEAGLCRGRGSFPFNFFVGSASCFFLETTRKLIKSKTAPTSTPTATRRPSSNGACPLCHTHTQAYCEKCVALTYWRINKAPKIKYFCKYRQKSERTTAAAATAMAATANKFGFFRQRSKAGYSFVFLAQRSKVCYNFVYAPLNAASLGVCECQSVCVCAGYDF